MAVILQVVENEKFYTGLAFGPKEGEFVRVAEGIMRRVSLRRGEEKDG